MFHKLLYMDFKYKAGVAFGLTFGVTASKNIYKNVISAPNPSE